VSEVNPADLPAGDLRTVSEEFDDVPDPPSPKKPEREGLPSTYRMRADAHYVDQLIARTDVAHAEPRRERAADRGRVLHRADKDTDAAADRPSDAAPRRDPREARIERAMAQLSADVTAILSAAASLGADAAPLARRVSTDLIQSQAWRAAWLLRAWPLVEGTHRWAARPRNLGAVLGQLRDRFAAECRLAGFNLHLHASDWNATVTIDEPALITGLAGAVIAALSCNDETDGLAVRVACTTVAGELRTVEVSQDGAAVPSHAVSRFFDPSWTDRPGGWVAGLGAAAARAIAQHQGGSASLAPADPNGTLIRLAFYRGTAG
jgi:hypothetical protein